MKAAIRESMLAKRLALTKQEINHYSQSLVDQIRALVNYQNANHIGIYSPIKNEPNLEALLTDHKQFYLPKVQGKDMIYVAFNKTTNLILSPLGIFEPIDDKDESQKLDFLIIPGVAFDFTGQRIGFGKGFFDRFLMRTRPKHVIGVAYPFQMTKQLYPSQYDMKVDLVLVA